MPRSIKACNRHNHTYHIEVTKGVDSDGTIESFEIRLFYRVYADGEASEFEVAVIEGYRTHTQFKQLFKKRQPTKIINRGYYDAIRTIDNNWESYADRYERNHRP